jgi:hypothetical protein
MADNETWGKFSRIGRIGRAVLAVLAVAAGRGVVEEAETEDIVRTRRRVEGI